MKIEFNPYAIVYTDYTDIYDVHFIIIDEEDKTIDVCDVGGFSIANIHYAEAKEIGYLIYTSDERLSGDNEILVKNGEVVIKNDNKISK